MDKNIIEEIRNEIDKMPNVKSAFGEPVEKDDITIIPVSKSVIKLSDGIRKSCCTENSEDKTEKKIGGSFKATNEPVGYIEIKNNSARFVTIKKSKFFKFIKFLFICFLAFKAYKLYKFFKPYCKKSIKVRKWYKLF